MPVAGVRCHPEICTNADQEHFVFTIVDGRAGNGSPHPEACAGDRNHPDSGQEQYRMSRLSPRWGMRRFGLCVFLWSTWLIWPRHL